MQYTKYCYARIVNVLKKSNVIVKYWFSYRFRESGINI
ncbi:hypothetical protein DDD_2660 [Nonlabens dokdonensis DSW-6]|uniref:Uncharacterized protein n=1 Tax=Nonlabens dokdonensis (strain DSM 17205 / KCTC 12402 / DSW-6) TaxID=592029 RepID=L7WC71_NONDD|nr:hypothetical protein DDD_2660 [Nonlabens dokdonensis DSW-6]